MSKLKTGGLFAGLAFASLLVCAAGLYTNGLVTIGAITVNGTTTPLPGGLYTQIGAGALIPVDTGLASGQNPQTVAATTFQIAARGLEASANTATSTAGAATLNTNAGLVTTESLSTAAGATYTFTLTDSVMTATSTPQVLLMPKSATIGTVTFTSSTCSSGSCVFVFTNSGTAAWNGTFLLAFHV